MSNQDHLRGNAQAEQGDIAIGSPHHQQYSQLPPAFTSQTGIDTNVTGNGRPQATSPARFASSSNAFGLSSASASSSSLGSSGRIDSSPVKAFDTCIPSQALKPRVRRPSLLGVDADRTRPSTVSQRLPPHIDTSLGQDSTTLAPLTSLIPDPKAQRILSGGNPFANRWSSNTPTPFLSHPLVRRTSSAPTLDLQGLRTCTPDGGERRFSYKEDRPGTPLVGGEEDEAMLDSCAPPGWPPARSSDSPDSPNGLKGKGRLGTSEDLPPMPNNISPNHPPFSGRPLPASLLATLISESAPLEHEMRSEARLQRLLSSHAAVLPLTPRAPRSARGRFPETAGDDDDDNETGARSWKSRGWLNSRAGSSDSDSDDMPVEDPTPDYVNTAFAAVMDMDRPFSSGEGSSTNGNGTDGGENGHPTPPSQGSWRNAGSSSQVSFGAAAGMVTTPGSGVALPNAFGGLGMGPTPHASPTVERLDVSGQSLMCIVY